MLEVPHSYDDRAAGPWWRYARGQDSGTALFRCPNGHYGTLSDHTIHDDGTVDPSVVCPAEGCTFHQFVRLLGWRPPPPA